ncbi:hypothetical protein [Scytonema sp. NUACC26]|uniref:hypothetical protein n=1 Tax=Scytonema sp. NUACC26 TaxID=3140176 RepID=UPI0038B4144A
MTEKKINFLNYLISLIDTLVNYGLLGNESALPKKGGNIFKVPLYKGYLGGY